MPDELPELPDSTHTTVDKPPSLTHAPPTGKLFPCLQCGAKVQFDPKTRSLKCPYCGFEQKVANFDGSRVIQERNYEEFARRLSQRKPLGIIGLQSQVQCTSCGAVILVDEKIVTDDCPFCGTHFVNKPEHAEEIITPESVIPFRVDHRTALHSFETWVNGLWFAPSELKKVANLGQLVGVFIPYWTYDAMTCTRYSGMRGDNYSVNETYTDRDAQGNLVTRTRTVIHTRWSRVSGEVQYFFDDVLVCGSKSLPTYLVRSVEPWQLSELEPFRDEFLAGMRTERYAIELHEGMAIAKRIIEPTIVSLIRQDIGGDLQQIDSKNTEYLGVTFKHCLLPVWVAHYHYREQLFQILINGRSGKVSGERPWSYRKILTLIGIIALFIGFMIAISSKIR